MSGSEKHFYKPLEASNLNYKTTMKEPDIEFVARNIVFQLGDFYTLSTELRQSTNNEAIDFVKRILEENFTPPDSLLSQSGRGTDNLQNVIEGGKARQYSAVSEERSDESSANISSILKEFDKEFSVADDQLGKGKYETPVFYPASRVKDFMLTQFNELLESLKMQSKTADKINGKLPLRAEENRNGYNSAVSQINKTINELKK